MADVHTITERTRKLVDAGSAAMGDLLQIEAQAAQEELQLINLKNQLESSYLTLTQLLELESPAGFEIVTPAITIDTNTVVTGNIDDIFNQAMGTRSEIKSSEYSLTSSEFDLKISSGARLPRITMSHSFSTGYSDIRKKIINDPISGPTYVNYSFADQVNDNINYGMGFTM